MRLVTIKLTLPCSENLLSDLETKSEKIIVKSISNIFHTVE